MASRKLGQHGDRRKLTLEERVNIAEGEDSLSESDDGLDIIPGGGNEVSFDAYINSIGGDTADDNRVIVSSDDEESGGSGTKRKRTTYNTAKGKRVAFDDDEDSDAAYKAFKNQKGEKRKKAIASTKRAKNLVKNASLVGRKPKTIVPFKDEKRKNGGLVYGQEDDEDEALMETTLPEYLKKRRSSFDGRREKLEGITGLQLPPSYDDVEFSDDENLEHLEERPRLPEAMIQRPYEDVELKYSLGIVPAPIAQYLRPYQIEGAEWLHEHFVYQKGGILGDDMGLGKTIQVIAFLTAAFGKTGDARDIKRMRKMRRKGDERWYPRVLVICPGTLMANWKNELDRWGWWHVYIYHGKPRDKEETRNAAHSGRLEIVITTYDTYRNDASAINGIRWDCVIADECHKIKERGAEITKAMNDINALCRIGTTGTAIQNKYEELWTLLNWTNPGKLGPMSTWKQTICIPLKIGQSHDATVSQLAKARRLAVKLKDNLLPKLFLRRTKELLKDQLPKKSDRVVFCPLTDTQAEAYNNFCDSELLRTIRDANEPCVCNSGKKQGWCCYTEYDDQKWQNFVFPAIATFQKLANHLALMIPPGESSKDKTDRELAKMSLALPHIWKDLYRQRDSIMNYANVEFCGKWKVLKKLLKLWHDNGDKALVFSHSVRLLRMLEMLFKATTTYNVSYLDGSMKYEDRQAVVDEYNSSPDQFVFLISTRAGGMGLNITSANKVVVVDPHWNPSFDLQAQDRAYRIGQTRDVDVFRLVSQGTVEEIVYARQIYKQQQANIGYNASVERRYFKGVQDNKEMKGEIFGLRNLFAPLSENVVLREIVNKTNVAETRAGVEIAGLDLEASHDNDDDSFDVADPEASQSAVMSQLAAEITDAAGAKRRKAEAAAGGRKKKDPVAAILASVGVKYTHENAEVIGTSKIETKISSRAQKAGNDLDFNGDKAFGLPSSQLEGPSNSGYEGVYAHKSGTADVGDEVDDVDGLGKIRYRYRPPVDVRKRQFCSMAKLFGIEDVGEFALVVEGWTQGQRRECLEKFYAGRRRVLAAS